MSRADYPRDQPRIGFGLMFFAADNNPGPAFYDFVLRIARYADERFRFISTPERHFHPFGGAFPNPSVMSAAIAAVTHRIQIRAGSLIAPLHNPIRIAEDWALIDNLSAGRAAIAFGTGWNVDDFVLSPGNYADRREVLRRMIRAIGQLWETGSFTAVNPADQPVSLQAFPRPVQARLNGWLTVSKSREGFVMAGEEGLNVLTHLETQDLATLAQHIAAYRSARERGGLDPASGVVTVMQHTLIGDDRVQQADREALGAYLTSAADLEARSVRHGGAMSGGRSGTEDQALVIEPRVRAEMVAFAERRFRRGASLVGTLVECERQVTRLEEAGADEIACLIDFVGAHDAIWASLAALEHLQARFSAGVGKQREDDAIARFLGSGEQTAGNRPEGTS